MDLVKSPLVPPHLAARYESDAGRYWDLFYRRNHDRFFKDRHYFEAEFPQLLAARTVLEVGCGAGNTVFPLLELNPAAIVYACDFADSAVQLVRSNPHYAASGRVHAFVADIAADDLSAKGEVPAGGIDVCTMVFVLSAISPEAMPRALRSVARTLRPGGLLLFRDYAVGDIAQVRLDGEGRQQRLGPNFYVRWDGTRAYYFTEDGLRRLFEAEGFTCQYVRVDERVQENRARGARMERRFIQAVFTHVRTSGRGSSGSRTEGGSCEGSLEAGGAGGNGQSSSGKDAGGRDEEGSGGAGGGQQAGGEGLSDSNSTGQAAVVQQQQLSQPHHHHPPHHHQWQQDQEGRGEEGLLEQASVQLGSSAWPLHLQLFCRLEPAQQQQQQQGSTVSGRAAAEAMAALVLSCPRFFHGADVLELCGWDAPLPALAALRWCRRVVAAGDSGAAVQLLRRNARLNSHLFMIERLRLQQLGWGWETSGHGAPAQHGKEESEAGGAEEQRQWQRAQLLRAFPDGFHAVLAAVPAESATQAGLQPLLGTAAALLSQQPGALVLLCMADQPAVQQEVAAAATAVQLQLATSPIAEIAQAAAGCSATQTAQPLRILTLQRLQPNT